MSQCEEHREVKETLGKIFGKLEDARVAQTRFEAKLDTLDSGIRKIQETLIGNGNPGLVTTVHELNALGQRNRGDIEKLSEWRYGPGENAARWAGGFDTAKTGAITRLTPWLVSLLMAALGCAIMWGLKP